MIEDIMRPQIFVFGSNYEGRHSKGGAHTALRRFGAKYGVARGLQGRSYGIPTKGYNLKILSLSKIKKEVDLFLKFAYDNPQMDFKVTTIGTGLAGYKHSDIAPMFINAPDNCIFDDRWEMFLGKRKYFHWNGKI